MSKKQIFLFYNIKVNYLMETQGNIVFSFGEYFDVHDGGHVHIHHGQEQSDSDTKPERQDGKSYEKMSKAIKEAADFINKHKNEYFWSDVWLLLIQKGVIGQDMSANRFGGLVEYYGGASAQLVRKTGIYQFTTPQLAKRRPYMDWLNAFFSDI